MRVSNIVTDFIVLRKTIYQESSLIISSLSKEFGKIDFILKGAKRVGKRSFPIVDIFRELRGQFQLRENGLNRLSTPDLICSFDSIINYQDNYLIACSIAQFVTNNTHPMVETPMLYSALKNSFKVLSSNQTEVPWLTLIKLVFLHEQGLIPAVLSDSNSIESERDKQLLLGKILEFACGGKEMPITSDYWSKLTLWVDQLCNYQSIKS